MKLSLCPQALYHLSLPEGLDFIASLEGVEALELPVHKGNPWVDLEELLEGKAGEFLDLLSSRGLRLSAVSNHQEGQLLLGPHHSDTDRIHRGGRAEKSAFAEKRLLLAGRLAAETGVGLVVGFLGCEDYSRFFPWPDPKGWESMIPAFREKALPILDAYADMGVAFAQEPHPKQMVFNIETALESVEILDRHPAWGFNLDPANLLLAGVDPVVFAAELGDRIFHVHGKDGEVVRHNQARSGLLARGDWKRRDRGFRFRVPGWGDVPWKRLISELVLAGYEGYIALENEDPLFDPLDGLIKGRDFLAPLLPRGKPRERWW